MKSTIEVSPNGVYSSNQNSLECQTAKVETPEYDICRRPDAMYCQRSGYRVKRPHFKIEIWSLYTDSHRCRKTMSLTYARPVSVTEFPAFSTRHISGDRHRLPTRHISGDRHRLLTRHISGDRHRLPGFRIVDPLSLQFWSGSP